jgi:hypothetical protein
MYPQTEPEQRRYLVNQFSLDELKDLISDLGENYENFPHRTKRELARELIEYCRRHERQREFDALVERVETERARRGGLKPVRPTNRIGVWRIIVDSQEDVEQERQMVTEVANEWNNTVGKVLNIHVEVKDRQKIAPLMGRRVEVILKQLDLDNVDQLILILWYRFDPASVMGELFEQSYTRWQASDGERPFVSVYRCERPVNPARIVGKQLAELDSFLMRIKNSEPLSTFADFNTEEEFKKRLTSDLTQLIHQISFKNDREFHD